METVTVEREIAAPDEAVFEWISNSHNYTRVPMILHERLVESGREAPYGTGAVRKLVWVIGCFSERITAYDPPYSFDYDVYRSIPPSRHEHGRVSLTAVSGGTKLVWTTTFEVRVPLIGAMLTRRIARPLFVYVLNKVVDVAVDDLAGRTSAEVSGAGAPPDIPTSPTQPS